MTARHLRLIAVASTIALVAVPAAAGDWFGVTISNNGLSLGFGTSSWGLWASSWDQGSWTGGFDTALTGYGEWIWLGGLGRVWRPWVAVDWQPFSYGRWVWTSMGWTWVAYEPWGWLPHHYGNWAMTTVGWVWTPGYTYSPGNVVWVSNGGYVGWIPNAPRGWSHAYRAYNRGWNDGYRNGYLDGWRDARYATWVPWSDMGADNVAHHAVRHEVAIRSVAPSSVHALAAPPTRSEVERRGNRPVPEARLVERTATVDGHQLKVVRPEGQEAQVRRYGGETVERALTPEARNRAVSRDASPRSTKGAETRVAVPSSRGSARPDNAVQVERSTSEAPSRSSRSAVEASGRATASSGRQAMPKELDRALPSRSSPSSAPVTETADSRRATGPRVAPISAPQQRSTVTPTTEHSVSPTAPAAQSTGKTTGRSRVSTVRRAPTGSGSASAAAQSKVITTTRTQPDRNRGSEAGSQSRSRTQPKEQPERSSSQQQRSRSRSRG